MEYPLCEINIRYVIIGSMGELEIDMTYGSLGTLGQTHFTLPVPEDSQDYNDEEEQMEELLARLEHAYPADLSQDSEYQRFSDKYAVH